MRLAALSLSAVCAALVVAAPAAVGADVAGILLAVAQQPAASATPRPFEHSRHEKLTCGACHGTGDQHRTLLVRTARDCASCHHDARRGMACRTCHMTEALPQTRAVTTPFSLSVSDTTRVRVLPFGHARHEHIACTECHQAPVTLQVNRECRSCHAQHEQRDADCATCHASDVRPKHGAASHLSCAGAGCHETRAAFQPAASRNTCLACHPQQRTHEVDGNCALCHRIPLNTARVTATPGGQR